MVKMNSNNNILLNETVEKLLDLLNQLEDQGNTIISDIKESTQNPIVKEKMKEKIKKFNELHNKINSILNSTNLNCLSSGLSYSTIIQFIEKHNKIVKKEADYNNKINTLAHDLNEISKTNQKIDKKKN